LTSTIPVALVTGGAGPGIGSAISTVLAERGYDVWVLDVDGHAADAVAQDIRDNGWAAHAATLDVADARAVEGVVARVRAESGRVDALVNSAGIGMNKPLADVSDDEFDRILGVDLRGAWLLTRAVMPLLIDGGGGAVVNIGSVHALGAVRDHGVYATAKAGLVALTRATARDYGRDGVRCNIVHPGAVNSDQTRELSRLRGEDPNGWLADFVERRQMLRRPVDALDVARTVAFLVSDDAAAITGAALAVDGGLHAMLWDSDREGS
jgi:NAD(P)-dependent dehydrogenase (short-subunit alcohol dehydrogenase family)